MPELPEMEAWRRALDGPVSAAPIEKAGPAHVATLKTFAPPLGALEGRRFAGARRRGKRLLFPTDDGELVLVVHLMTAGRLRYLDPGAKGPKTPAFRLRFGDGAELVMTEAGKKKRAGVWLLTPGAGRGRAGPPRAGGARARAGAARRDPPRRGAAAARVPARPARARRDRPRLGERDPPRRAPLPLRALDAALATRRSRRLAAAIDAELERGLELRERGAADAKVYRVHNRLGEPCHVCGEPLRRVDFEEHTIYYCATCQTGGRVLKDRRLSRLLR